MNRTASSFPSKALPQRSADGLRSGGAALAGKLCDKIGRNNTRGLFFFAIITKVYLIAQKCTSRDRKRAYLVGMS
jgi:hypothetical protein